MGVLLVFMMSSITGVANGVTNPTFTYDNNGNLTSGAERTMTWTSFNQVASVTQGGLTLTYTYDGEHQRINASTHQRINASNKVMAPTSPST